MLQNLSKGVLSTSLIGFLFLTSCGPVQFTSPAVKDAPNVTEENTPTPTDPTATLRNIETNTLIEAKDNKLDIILVVDDSNSMLPDNQKLAAKLNGFVTQLQNSNIDWQMCATVTRALPVSSTQNAWGASIYWQNSTTASSSLGMVLKKGTANLSNIFTNTINYINAGWANSDDERGIKAAWHHVYNGDLRYQPNNGCYREDSAIAYIIISDEDERSIAGDASQQVYSGENKPLEEQDKPAVLVSYIKEVFGNTRRFTVNSIIVKPGDTSCKASQDAGGAKSHYGFKYAELSNLTGGGVGSICAEDYATNLNLFLERIQDSLSSVPLECSPYNGNITVTITPTIGPVQSRIEGQNLVFDTPVPAGHSIALKYQCSDRAPSSVAKPVPLAQDPGFFAKIVNFFKSLF
ncbi:hypothetical protein ACES2L_02710 [Bdellovibrio bacteriovorus]